MLLEEIRIEIIWKQLAYVASVSVVFRSKEKSKKDSLDFLAVGKMGREKNIFVTGGEEGRKPLPTNPMILKTLCSSDMAYVDYLSLNQSLWTCVNHK